MNLPKNQESYQISSKVLMKHASALSMKFTGINSTNLQLKTFSSCYVCVNKITSIETKRALPNRNQVENWETSTNLLTAAAASCWFLSLLWCILLHHLSNCAIISWGFPCIYQFYSYHYFILWMTSWFKTWLKCGRHLAFNLVWLPQNYIANFGIQKCKDKMVDHRQHVVDGTKTLSFTCQQIPESRWIFRTTTCTWLLATPALHSLKSFSDLSHSFTSTYWTRQQLVKCHFLSNSFSMCVSFSLKQSWCILSKNPA